MTDLLLKFGVILEEPQMQFPYHHYGPLFHRWLPNGVQDAIQVSTTDPEVELRVWFEQSGYVDREWDNLIKFDYTRREIDPQLLRGQAVLDAGPLRGSMTIHGLQEETLAAIRENSLGNANYVALGKRVVRLLFDAISRIINILRTSYGQYWISEIETWDSRTSSLGHYCGTMLQIKYSLDEGASWHEFTPNEPMGYATLTVTGATRKTFIEYLTEQDWSEFQKAINDGFKPPLAAVTLARAHQLSDQGNLRQAFIEGVTAMELALSDMIRAKLGGNQLLITTSESFWTLPLRAQLTIVSAISGSAPLQDIEQTIKALETRNKIVHDGWQPTDTNRDELRALLTCVASLLPGPKFRFPSANTHNNISLSSGEWDRLP